ncbi:hypothetical protein [Winogradskyella helgolandensis]|jgi:hypothetical protein|uniref:hypothetical protein n=1 Tax=Winogradskyella helgolandensis TaxID=2697010 RepID=UPI0015BB0776|nr:hypothetical protein [Winogradskyella helgolandensis]
MRNSKIIKCSLILLLLTNFSCFIFCNGKWAEYDKNYLIKIESISQTKGAICVNDSLKIDVSYNNDKPYPTMLHDFIAENDSLIVPANNDTIFIVRNDKKYWFKKYGITSFKSYSENDN